MTIPAATSDSNYDAATDDPKQARSQLSALQQAYEQTRSFQGGGMGSLTATDAGTLNVDSVDAGTIYVAAQAGSPTPVISDLGTPTRGAPWKLLVFEAGITIQHAAGSLELPGAANIITEDNDSAVVVYDTVGSPGFWRVISYTRAARTPGLPLLHVRDEKSSTTEGGTFTSGAWRTRDLNTVVTNQISGASLSSNQITLPAGTYLCIASAPAFSVDRHQARLYNVTDTAVIAVGWSSFTDNLDLVVARAEVRSRFTLTAAKTIELQHRCETTSTTTGFGVGNDFTTEVYSDAMIWKVG